MQDIPLKWEKSLVTVRKTSCNISDIYVIVNKGYQECQQLFYGKKWI